MPPAAVTREMLEQCWNDQAHWSLGLYFCKQDSRVVVPMGWRRVGWTVNLAHRAGAALFIAVLTLPLLAAAIACAIYAVR